MTELSVHRRIVVVLLCLCFILRRIVSVGVFLMEYQLDEAASTRPLAVRAALAAGNFLLVACFFIIDSYHLWSLRVKAGERAVPRTKRRTIPPAVRRRIIARQGGLCMYCGVDLMRLNRNQRHIDHMDPVERGGPDVEENMQGLCGRCNSRKGVQTDGEFRERYRELLAWGFALVSRLLPAFRRPGLLRFPRRLASSPPLKLHARQSSRPRLRKSLPLVVTAGGVLGVVWFLLFGSLLGDVSWGGNFALLGGFVVVGVTWGGSMWRARVTGILDAEYVDKGMLVGSARRRG